MPSRVRDRHLAEVLEALIRYSAEGHRLTFRSEREAAELRITFSLGDAESYHKVLAAVMSEGSTAEEGGDPAEADENK